MKKNEYDSFIMYGSYYAIADDPRAGISEDEKLRLYGAIMKYGATGAETEGLNGAAFAIYEMSKPLIDAAKRNREAGSKGGRKKAENAKKSAEERAEMYDAVLAEAGLEPEIEAALREHIKSREESKKPYTATALKSAIKKATEMADKHGTDAVVECIEQAVQSGWQGIFYEPKKSNPKTKSLVDEFMDA